MTYTITRDDGDKDARFLRDALDVLAQVGGGVNEEARSRLYSLADSIEEQVPTIEEPTEWGSVVRARRVGYGAEDTTALRWQRQNTQDGNDSWTSEPAGDLGIRYSSHWIYLAEPEVLRVGVGEDPDSAAFNEGFDVACNELIKDFTKLRADDVGGWHSAFDLAIAAVENQKSAR